MSLDEIEEIRADIKKLRDEREINIIEAKESILKIKERYSKIVSIKGKEYCDKNYTDVLVGINNLSREFNLR